MAYLSEQEFLATFMSPMQRIDVDEEPAFDFWSYYETIPVQDYAGYDCSAGTVTYAWRDASGRYEHVLLDSDDRNVFMVLVLDRKARQVMGHRLLDLPTLYGLAG